MIDKEKVASFKLFNQLNLEEVDEIISISREVVYKANEIIVREGSEGVNISLILEGRVVVELKSVRIDNMEEGNVFLATLADGDIFGEISFLKKKFSSAQVIAKDDVRILKIENHKLEELFEGNNHLGYFVMRNLATILSQRIVNANLKLRNL